MRTKQRNGSRRGEGRLGCIFWSLLFLIAALVAIKVVPVKMATMQLRDFMEELAMTQPRQTQGFFEKEIFHKAEELRLDIPKDKIQVKKTKERVIMDVNFVVPLDFLVYKYDWNVKIHLDRDIFLV